MNEELTREVLEDMATCRERGCPDCKGVCRGETISYGIETLAKALLAEMEKPGDDVWKDAPEWADVAEVCWRDKANTKHKQLLNPLTRELPKTRARQIAEQEGQGLAKKNGWSVAAGALVANVVESALNKYAEELEEKEATR